MILPLATSVSILKKRCQEIFDPATLLLMVPNEDLIWPRNAPVNVVIMGSPLNLITQKTLWIPQLKIRIWVLSETHKKLLTHVIGIFPEDVSVIPRYLLFPIKKPTAYNDNILNQEINLVFSGRITAEKNFELCVNVANLIQQKSEYKVSFSICGPKLNLKRKYILTEVNKYKWKTRPKLLGDLGVNWHKIIKDNPVLLNLSSYRQEDFGVSVAQAQQVGWPLILSDWGGHRDVVDWNCIKINPNYIKTLNFKKIVNVCFKKKMQQSIPFKTKLKRPRIISYDDIEKQIDSKNVKKLQSLFFDDHLVTKKKLPKNIENILMGKFI